MSELETKRKATELLQKGRYEEAVQEYESLLATQKKPSPAILNVVGDIWVKAGMLDKAFEAFLKASRAYADEGLYHNGIAVGKKILRFDKEQTEIYGMLGSLYAKQGLGMDCVKFLNQYAKRKERAKEYPAALAAFAEACEILADFSDVHVVYGQMLERVGRHEDAAVCFDNAAQIYGDRGMTAQATEWSRKAKSARGEEILDDGDVGVSDLMNLRDLDGEPATPVDSSPPAEKAERSRASDLMNLRDLDDSDESDSPEEAEDARTWGRSDEPDGLALDDGAEEGAPLNITPEGLRSSDDIPTDPDRYVAGQNPGMPPPPPLPPAPSEAATADESLELDLGSPAASAEAPAEVPPVEEEEETLDSLPGIIMPGKEMPSFKSSAAGPAPPAPEPIASAPAETAPPEPTPEAPAPPEIPTEVAPLAADAPPAPTEPVLPADPIAASQASPGMNEVPELQQFFEAASGSTESGEHTIVIGDDFELVREGGDVSEVISDFRDATMEILDLDDFQAHYDLGTTYMEMELFDEAAAEFEIAARGKDYALASQEMLGYCFLRKGQIDHAIRELERGLAIQDAAERDKLGLYYNLGIACGVLDKEHEAIANFQRILAVDPDFRDTKSRLERLVQNSNS